MNHYNPWSVLRYSDMQYTSDTPCYVVSFTQAEQKSNFSFIILPLLHTAGIILMFGSFRPCQLCFFNLDRAQNQREEMVLVEGVLNIKSSRQVGKHKETMEVLASPSLCGHAQISGHIASSSVPRGKNQFYKRGKENNGLFS